MAATFPAPPAGEKVTVTDGKIRVPDKPVIPFIEGDGADAWEEMTSLAENAAPFTNFIDPEHPDFLNPPDMPVAIWGYCARAGQPDIEFPGAILRCIFESLALKYRRVLEKLEELLGYNLEVVHIIGGGSQNRLLCQLTADACGMPVVAGPVEATAIGNALVQAISLRYVNSLSEGRQLVGRRLRARCRRRRRPRR